jgi:uncharacterized protein (TIGR02001 family)
VHCARAGIRILAAMRRREGKVARSGILGSALLKILMLAAVALPAKASDGPWSASVGATTDYVFRGVSQTYDSGALQLGANYQSPHGWFAGTWASNVDPYPFGVAALELDVYAGFRQPLSDQFNTTLTYTHYQYLHDARPLHYDYDELAFSASYLDEVVASISYQPDSTLYSALGAANHRATVAYEMALRWPLPAGFALTAGAGYYDLHRLFGVHYWAGNAGLQYVYRRVTFDLSRFFADSTVSRLFEGASADGTWVLSAIYRF